MKKYQNFIFPALIVIGLIAWVGRSRIRNFFPVQMSFSNMQFTSIDDKKPVKVNEYKGNVVIVSCYQTWCSDCARETPVINELAAKLQSDKFKVLYISNEEEAKVSGFRQRFPSDNITYLKSESSMEDLGIKAFPTTFLLNKNGEVIKTKLEGYDWLQEEEAIKKMLAE